MTSTIIQSLNKRAKVFYHLALMVKLLHIEKKSLTILLFVLVRGYSKDWRWEIYHSEAI